MVFALRRALILSLSVAILSGLGCGRGGAPAAPPDDEPVVEFVADLEQRLATFVPVAIEARLEGLDETEIEVLGLLVAASRLLDPVFLRQAGAENPRWRRRIAAAGGRGAAAALDYFDLQYGIYERQNDWRPFVTGAAPRPKGAGFYPADLTLPELEAFLAAHPDREAEIVALTTVVVRDGPLLAGVPFSEAYQAWLRPAAEKLGMAATATHDRSLRVYLAELQRALASDVYRAAETAWMDVEGRLDLTFGPYETYEDDLLGSKASFAAFVTVTDPDESARLSTLVDELPRMELRLPIPDEHKNLERGTESPIRIADLVFSAGDARAGIQTLAFNLPNDEEIREQKGSKKVLLRNVMAAKFRAILAPVASRLIDEEQIGNLDEETFIELVLFHELSHALGPGRVELEGKRLEVREALLEHHDTIEEAKADIVGLWNLMLRARDRSGGERKLERLFVTHVAGLFRSVRFGAGSAHGRAAAIQYALLSRAGAIVPTDDGERVRIDTAAFAAALGPIARELLMLQALPDREHAGRFIAEHGILGEELTRLTARLQGVPVDIRPIYTFAGEAP